MSTQESMPESNEPETLAKHAEPSAAQQMDKPKPGEPPRFEKPIPDTAQGEAAADKERARLSDQAQGKKPKK